MTGFPVITFESTVMASFHSISTNDTAERAWAYRGSETVYRLADGADERRSSRRARRSTFARSRGRGSEHAAILTRFADAARRRARRRARRIGRSFGRRSI